MELETWVRILDSHGNYQNVFKKKKLIRKEILARTKLVLTDFFWGGDGGIHEKEILKLLEKNLLTRKLCPMLFQDLQVSSQPS